LDTALVATGHTALVEVYPFGVDILVGVKSPNTLEQYKLHWQTYTQFAITWAEATQPATLARWRQHLLEVGYTGKNGHHPYTVNAINLRLAAIRSVMHEAAQQGYISHETAKAFKAIEGLKQSANKERRRAHARTAITPEDMDCICNAPDTTTAAGMMHRALLLTLRGTGGRISDVVTMTTAQVQEYESKKDKRRGWVVYLMDKNESEPTPVEISRQAKEAIDAWLVVRRARFGIDVPDIFTGFTGRGDRQPAAEHITRQAAWQLVIRYAGKVGLQHIKPHDFRRYVGTQLAESDIRLAQKQLRHKRIETTAQHYVLDDVKLGHMDSL
jgi:integrase